MKDSYVGEVEQGLMSIGRLAARVRALLRDYGEPVSSRVETPRTLPSPRREPGSKASGAREEVISRLLAADAETYEGVGSFRTEVLRGTLLRPEEVDRWIEERADARGQPSEWLTVPVPPGYQVKSSITAATTEPPLTISEETPAILIQRRYLSYESYREPPHEDPRREVPTAEGGVLERLRQLSQALARSYGWDQALATNFVLTGEIPRVRSIEIEGRVPSNFSTLARISLTIDPALSPREVADHYRRFRGEILGGRHRELSEKHMRLATFTAARPTGETLRQRMVAWNKEYPGWSYKRETNFGRDCQQAIQRLLHPDYGPEIKI